MARRTALLAAVVALAHGAAVGCRSSHELDPARTASLFTEVVIDTAPGLSGLAADPQGRLWTVSERGERAYRITLDASNRPTLETFRITDLPADIDLEGIEELGADRFALGTEGRDDSTATVLLAELRGDALAVTQTITLTAEQIGIAMARNHGAEGVCGHGDSLIVAIEGAGEADGKRFAPVLRVERGRFVQRHRVWLTSTTGKLSGLDCTLAADGSAEVWAIERHFEVTRLLAFTLPAPAAGAPADGAPAADITPRIALDLGAVVAGKRNLEGIAQLPDGRIVTVADNQWKRIEGPSTLQVFTPGAVK